MRYGVALGLAVGLLAVPASARQQTETVTLKVGQTTPLKTSFNKSTKYTITVSGLVTLTPTAACVNCVASTYDPFHGVQAKNCENNGGGVAVNFQINDPRGPTINASDAYKPPVYTIPCRKDHTYVFQLNDAYPPSWDINGKASAYIPLEPDPTYWTASGSFKLSIEPDRARRDVILKVLATDERSASKVDPLLADARFVGSGRIVDLDSDEPEVRGVFALKLMWVERDDTELTLKPVKLVLYNKKKRSVFVLLEVVKSNDRTCKIGFQWNFAMRQGASDQAALQSRGCNTAPTNFLWSEPRSAIATTVKEVEVTN
jgi:hypothetical protein